MIRARWGCLAGSLTALAFVLTWGVLALAQEENLGGPGESCRARSDCKHGLKCLANICVDEHEGQSCAATSDCGTLRCIDNKCVNPLARPQPPVQPPPPPVAPPPPPSVVPPAPPPEPVVEAPPSRALQEWLHFQRGDRVHPFVGFTVAAGFLNGGYTASEGTLWASGLDGAFLFALRGGVLMGRHELALEIAPFTDFWDLHVGPGPAFEANASYGYMMPLRQGPTAGVSWPLRVGAGVLAGGDNTASNVLFELRADLIGVSINVGHLLIDLHAPSFRYALTNGHVPGIAVEGVTTHWLSFFFGTTVSYVF